MISFILSIIVICLCVNSNTQKKKLEKQESKITYLEDIVRDILELREITSKPRQNAEERVNTYTAPVEIRKEAAIPPVIPPFQQNAERQSNTYAASVNKDKPVFTDEAHKTQHIYKNLPTNNAIGEEKTGIPPVIPPIHVPVQPPVEVKPTIPVEPPIEVKPPITAESPIEVKPTISIKPPVAAPVTTTPPVAAGAPIQPPKPAPVAPPVQATPPKPAAPQPQTYAASMADHKPVATKIYNEPIKPQNQKEPTKTENLVGRYGLSIAASVLVFIGLIFLGLLVYQSITDEIKIASMFVISTAITGVGLFLCTKSKNTFAQILTGCGFGSIYISIMATHLYFGKINDITAFSLLLVWLIITLVAARLFKSLSVSIVAHMGMVISVCSAFLLPISDRQLVMLVIYQLVSIAVIIIGNIYCCKKTYRFGLFVSLFLTLVAGGSMWVRFFNANMDIYKIFLGTELPVWFISLAFIAQFICASFVSYLLSVSTSRLEDKRIAILLHISNKILWTASFVMNIYYLIYNNVFYSFNPETAISKMSIAAVASATLSGFIILIIHAALSIFMNKKLKFNRILETMSVSLMSFISFVLLIIFWVNQFTGGISLPKLSLIIIPALLMLLAGKMSKNKVYRIIANVFLAIDFIFMAFNGYYQLNNFANIFLPTIYMVLYLIILWGQWCFCDENSKEKYNIPVRVLSYLPVIFSSLIIIASSSINNKVEIFLISMTVLNILLFFFKYDGIKEKLQSIHYLMRINEFAFIFINILYIATAVKSGAVHVYMPAIIILTAFLVFVRAFENLWKNGINTNEESLYIIKLVPLIMSAIYAHTKSFYYCGFYMMISLTTVFIILYFARIFLYKLHDLTADGAWIDHVLRYGELVVVFINSLIIAFAEKNTTTHMLCAVLAVISICAAFLRIKKYLLADNVNTLQELFYVLKIAAIINSVVYFYTKGLANTHMYILITLSMLFITVHFCRIAIYKLHNLSFIESLPDPILRYSELSLVFINALVIAFTEKGTTTNILCAVLAAVSIFIAFLRAKEYLIKDSVDTLQELFYMLKIAAVSIGVVYFYTRDLMNTNSYILMMISALCIAFYFCRVFIYKLHNLSEKDAWTDIILKYNEIIWFFINSAFIAFAPKTSFSNILFFILAALTAGIFVLRAGEMVKAKTKVPAYIEILHGIQLTVLMMAVIKGNTEWFENSYIISIVCMLSAMVCVIFGFIYLTKHLRLYGLLLTVICVLKLVILDVANENTYTRVFAFIGGGLICFVISAIYSYAVKKVGGTQEEEENDN